MNILVSIKRMVLTSVLLLATVGVFAADGDVFTASVDYVYLGSSKKKADMRFQVISETAKTCRTYGYQVGSENFPCLVNKDKDYDDVWIPEYANGYKVVEIGSKSFYNQYLHGTIYVPQTVTSIPNNAFYYAQYVNYIYLPDNIESIGESAFSNCGRLKSITLPKNLKTINNFAFAYCKELTSITIPESVEVIGYEAFGGTGITSVFIPENVKSFGISTAGSAVSSPFARCKLNSVSVAEANQYYDSRNNCNCVIETSTGILVTGSASSVIPSGVVSTVNYAFANSDIKTVTLPNTMKNVGWGCFAYSALETVTISGTVTTMGNEVFKGCKNLKQVNLPKSLTYVGWDTFRGCTSLEKVYISNGTLKLSTNMFDGCSALKSVTYMSETPQEDLTIGSAIFKGIAADAKLYVLNRDAFNKFPFNEWFKSGNIIQIQKVTRVDITDYDWPVDFIPADYTANSTTPGCVVSNIQYERYQKTLDLSHYGDVYTDDYFGIGFTVDLEDGYMYGSGLSGYIKRNGEDIKHEFIIIGENDFQKRFVWTYRVPVPEGGKYVRSISENITSPHPGEYPDFQTESMKNASSARPDVLRIKEQFDRDRTYTVEKVLWYRVDLQAMETITNPNEAFIQMNEGVDRFEKGGAYIAILCLKADDGFQFHKKTPVFINSNFDTKPNGASLTLNAKTETDGFVNYDGPAVSVQFMPANIKGDINGDGEVNTSDVTVLYNVIFGTDKTTQQSICDINGDGAVNTTDVTELYNIIFGTAN